MSCSSCWWFDDDNPGPNPNPPALSSIKVSYGSSGTDLCGLPVYIENVGHTKTIKVLVRVTRTDKLTNVTKDLGLQEALIIKKQEKAQLKNYRHTKTCTSDGLTATIYQFIPEEAFWEN